MAYKAQIEVAVAGLSQVKQLRQDIEFISKNIDKVGKGGRGGRSSKEEVKNQTTLNNLLNSNAVQYGRSLQLQKKGKDIEQEKLKYIDAASEALEGNYKAAKELISANRLSNTQKKNELITTEKSTKSQEKSLRVSRQRAESINALEKAQHRNFNLRRRLDDLDRSGVNVDKLRLKYGELNTAQGQRNFGSFRKIGNALDLNLKKELNKLRILTKQNKERLKEANFLKRMGGARSPIRGHATRDVGSPAFNERSARMGGPRSALNYQRGQLRPGPRGTGGGGVAQSAIISGAFPLLFGQGPITAAAGAVGGGVGAKVGGQMGGFAGGLAATAAVSAIQQAVASVSKLGQAMSSLVPDIDALINSMGQAGTAEGIRLKVIEQARGKQAALNAAMKNMTRIVGEKGVKGLQEWGEASRKLSESWSRFMLKMGAGFARLLNWADKFFGLSKAADRGKARDFAATSTDPKIKALFKELRAAEIRNNRSSQWGGPIPREGDRSVSAIEKDLFGADGKGGLVGTAQEVEKQKELKELYGDLLDSKLKEQELLKARIAGNYEEVRLNFDIAEEIKRQENSVGKIAEKQKEKIESTMRENERLKEQYELTKKIKDAWKSITAEITGSIKDGIKGLIKGTATWADMLNNIADKFLDMALNQAFYGNIMGELGKGSGGLFGLLGFANGGRPPVGEPSIVGEKGPELFVPSSSGKIIPNHELGGGGGVNVTVNVDASGTDVQGDDSQAKQLGTMLSAAVQAELVKQKRPGGLLAGVA